MTYLIDGKTPGQFRARCAITKPHPVKDLPGYLRREYADKGWAKGHREVGQLAGALTECFLEPLCEGFESTDPAAFAEHMKKAHGKGEVKGCSETWMLGIRKGWSSPRLAPAGKPLVKAAAEATRCCGTCGLVAEVDDRPTNVLWWAEHERMCVGSAVA